MTDPLFLAPDAARIREARPGHVVMVTGDEARHAVVVRRVRPGETVYLSDGHGHGIHGEVVGADRETLAVRVGEVLTAPVPPVRFTVVQALAKGERSDIAIEALTELGVDRIVAWQASRAVVRWEAKSDKGLAKWRATVREAAKQSRRLRVPEVEYESTRQVLERVRAADLAVVLHESAAAWLSELEFPVAGSVVFVVGPEGGVSDDELATFEAAGARPALVSDAVLRTSTAGPVALAQAQALIGRP